VGLPGFLVGGVNISMAGGANLIAHIGRLISGGMQSRAVAGEVQGEACGE
jgi:hypothetical protein